MTVTLLWIHPLNLRDAAAYIAQHHRHHAAPRGHRWSLGLSSPDGLHGVIVCGRPVARLAGDPLDVLEVTRLCTDGTPNACTMLLGAAARAGKAMGYRMIQTYTLPAEGGASLRAAGWELVGLTASTDRQWAHTDGKPRRTDQPNGPKLKWCKHLATRPAMDAIRVTR